LEDYAYGFSDFVGFRTMSKPLTVAEPDVGGRIVQSMDMAVVLPAPFGPSNPNTSLIQLLRIIRPLLLVDHKILLVGGFQ